MAAAGAAILPTPSDECIVPGSFNIPIAIWPPSSCSPSSSSSSVNGAAVKDKSPATTVSSNILSLLTDALSKRDGKAVSELFLQQDDADGDGGVDGYWRDHLCMSWDLRTLKGRDKISSFLSFQNNNNDLDKLKLELDGGGNVDDDDDKASSRAPKMTDFRNDGSVRGIQFFIKVTTRYGSGRGVGRLLLGNSKGVEKKQDWKIWTLFTSLESLRGHEEPLGHNRVYGVQHGPVSDRKNWLERRAEECQFEKGGPDVLIVGCGQAGLSVSARLKMLGVTTLIVDTNNEIGDNWRHRYHQLVLHDPVWYDHMPYIPFPAFWPVFTPKDKLADFLRSYAYMLELNVWTSTSLESSEWDPARRHWTVVLKRTTTALYPLSPENNDEEKKAPITKTELRTLHPLHIVQATGHSGKPNYHPCPSSSSRPSVPSIIPGISNFRGPLICHSSSFPGAQSQPQPPAASPPKLRSAVVVGSSNSALDIAHDYYEKGYRPVTVIQRSSTAVMSSSAVVDLLLGSLYREGGGIRVEDADLLAWSLPSEIFKAVCRDIVVKTREGDQGEGEAEKDGETLKKLREAGFMTDDGPDGCGLWFKYLQRGGWILHRRRDKSIDH